MRFNKTLIVACIASSIILLAIALLAGNEILHLVDTNWNLKLPKAVVNPKTGGDLFNNDSPAPTPPPAEICNNGIDDDGDGLIDCADPDCTTTSYATTVTSQTGVVNPNDALGAPNSVSAQLYDANDQIVLDFGTAKPTGATFTIRWRRDPGTSADPVISVERSADGTNFTSVTGSPFTFTTTTYFNQAITVSASTRYLRFINTNVYNTDLDAVTVTFCLAENCTNGIDDDGDGLIDLYDPDCVPAGMQMIPPGSFIIDMGFVPQTINNAIKPYGLVWHLIHQHSVPVLWSINSAKSKDGVDFTTENRSFRGAPFIISAEYRTTAVNTLIQSWQTQGVLGFTTTQPFLAPVGRTLNHSMNWTINSSNGDIVKGYLLLAGIPESAFNWKLPANLNGCNDVFLMPHADPTWDLHQNLLDWNKSVAQGGSAGAIWAGCRAPSELENTYKPSDPSLRMNFLMLSNASPTGPAAVAAGNHHDGSLPPPYNYAYPAHPVMQFMGLMDRAQENGSEQIYLPVVGWRPNTMIGVWDNTHVDVPSLSPGPAAKLAFGPAFGDNNRGKVAYQGGHRLDKAHNPENIAALRAFLNFSFFAAGQKAIQATASVPPVMKSTTVYNLSAGASGGSGNYIYTWTSSCGGTFSNPNSSTTTFTAPNVTSITPCYIQVKVVDDCGTRTGFVNTRVSIVPVPAPPLAVNDNEITAPGSPITINVLNNDSDPNLDPLTVTSLIGPTNTGNGVFSFNSNGNVTYTPNFNFTGTDTIRYQVCDTTSVSDGGPLCATAKLSILVSWIDANGCYPNQYYGISASGNADAVTAQNSIGNASSALGAPDLVASSNTYYAKIDGDGDYLVLDLTATIPIGDTVWIYFGTDDGNSGQLRVQGTLTSTNYAIGAGFYDLSTYTSSKDLDASNPQQDTVAYIPTTGSIRYLRFTRATGMGKPSVNGVSYVLRSCLSAVPTAVNDSRTVCEDNISVLDVRTNDYDPQGLDLTVSIVTPPANGIATAKTNGTIAYLPNKDFSGSDNLVYEICNTLGLCAQATVTITVTDDLCPTNTYRSGTNSPLIYSFQGGGSSTFKRYIVSSNSWSNLANAPATVSSGGALASDGTYVYGFRGGDTKTFWRYDINANSWTSRADAPDEVLEGGALIYDGTNIYASKGDDDRDFWRYNIGTNSWTVLANSPADFRWGASLAADDTYIYALRGDDSNKFWKYNKSTNTWTALQTTPSGVKEGGAMVLAGDYLYTLRGKNTKTFWRYNFSSNTWSVMASTPANVYSGGALSFDGTYIYASAGNGSTAFWRYNISSNTWSSMATTTFNYGGAMIAVNGITTCTGSCVSIPVYPPVAVSDTLTVAQGQSKPVAVQDNDSDPQGLGLTTYLGVSKQPTKGSVQLDGKRIVYTASAEGTGQDTFNYKICNIYGCDSALVLVNLVCAIPAESSNAIHGTVFKELNGNVIRETGEPGVENVKVRLYIDSDNNGVLGTGDLIMDSILTDANGKYLFQVPETLGGGSSGGTSSIPVTISKRVTASSDDVEEEGPEGVNLGPGGMYLTSSDLELTQDLVSPSSGTQKIGLRFTGLTIPNGAVITSAFIDFVATTADAPNTNNNTTNLSIKGQATDNALTFTSSTYNLTNRATTSSAVAWSPASWTAEQVYSTPNLVSIIQEIVNRPGWNSGNALAMIFTGTGSRSAYSFDGSSTKAPLLRITYEMPTESTDPTLGDAVWSDAVTPKTNAWDATSFGTAQNTVTYTDRWRVMSGDAAPYRDEKIVVGIGTSGAVAGQLWDGSSWSNLSINPMGTVSETFWWGADVAYEQLSGDALVVWNANPNLKYSVWNGATWTTPATISTPISGEAKQIRLAHKPGSDEIVAVVASTGGDYALVWNGSSWGNAISLNVKSGNSDFTDVWVAYEHNTGRAMVAFGKIDGTSTDYAVHYVFWNGSSWSSPALFQPNPTIAVSSRAKWISLAADPTSNRIGVAVITTSGNAWTNIWSGTAWGTPLMATTATASTISPNLAFSFETASGKAILAYGKSGESNVYYRTWNSTSNWSSEFTGTSAGSVTNSIIAYPNAASNHIMLAVQNSSSQLRYVNWSGTAWSSAFSLSFNTSETKNQPFVFLWNQLPELTTSGASGYYIMQVDTTTFPAAHRLVTDNIETAVFTGFGEVDCNNDFGLSSHLPPVVRRDTAYIETGITGRIMVTANDYDPEGTTLTITVLTNPANGTVVNNGEGSVNYTSGAGFTGTVSFNYKACDGGIPILCDSTTVVVIVNPFVNDPPIAGNDYDTTSVNQSVTITVLENDFDPEFDNLTVSLNPGILQPANGTLAVWLGKKISYTPNTGFSGNDSFDYIVCDNRSPSLCDTARVFIYVKNTAPDALDDVATTGINIAAAIPVLANDIDLDGHSLILISAGTNPANPASGTTSRGGTVSVNNNGTPGNPADDYIYYTPPNGYTGQDTFYYKINDNGVPVGSDIARVIVKVTPVIDLELTKTVSPDTSWIGQNVTFTLTLTNKGPTAASAILIRDKLPSSYAHVSNNGNGTYDPNSGIWYRPSLGVNQSVSLTITATVLNASNLKNVAQVYAANEKDSDSTPNNYSGNPAEDDEAAATPFLKEWCNNGIDDDGDGLTDCADSDCYNALTAYAGSNVTICLGQSTVLTGSATGGFAPLSFAWSHGLGTGTTKTVSPASSTTYTLTVTSSTGCTSQAQVSVTVNPVQTVSTSPGATICSGSSTTISASASGGTGPYTYSWSHSLGTGSSKSVSPTTTTTYAVTVTGSNGCTATGSVTVTVNASPVVDAGPNVTICNGHTTTLTATVSGGVGPFTYVWNQGLGTGSSKVVSPNSTRNYYVTVTGSNGCEFIDSVRVTVENCPEDCSNGLDEDGDGLIDCADSDCGPAVSAGQNVVICYNTSTTLYAVPSGGKTPYTIEWSHGLGTGTTKTVTPLSSTTYTVTVTSSSGCSATSQVTVSVVYCDENCTNGIDDDGDGLVDCDDPDCITQYQPVTVNDTFNICPGLPFSERVTINDSNLSNAGYSIISWPVNGDATLDQEGKLTYMPYSLDCTTDSLVYQVCNTVIGCCNTAKVMITIGDTIPPVLTNVPADLTISCSETVPAPSQVFGYDTCPGIYLQFQETSTKGSAGACGAYAITRTWTATDLCGNNSSATQLINVADMSAPEFFRVYTLQNGKKLVAGVVDKATHNWNYVSFPQTFTHLPLVFAQVNSTNEATAVTVRIRNITTKGFEIRLQEQENADNLHAAERLSWFAIEPGTSNADVKIDAGVLASVTHAWKTLNFAPIFAQVPVQIFTVQTNAEADPISVRYRNGAISSVEIHLQEETSKDTEIAHAAENVAYFCLPADANLKDKDGEYIGESGTLNLTNAWAGVKLKRKYNKPVVVLGGISWNDPTPATIRVRNVLADSFEVRIHNWDYAGGTHSAETVTYLVLEGSVSPSSVLFCDYTRDSLQYGTNLFYRDNCDVLPVVSTSTESMLLATKKVTTRQWSASDACSNSTVTTRLDTCNIAALRLKAVLAGAYLNNGGTDRMRDDLRKSALVPVSEPFSSIAGFKLKGDGLREAINPTMLSITGDRAIVDWVLVELRDAGNDRTIVATKAALLLRDGNIVSTTGDSIIYFENLGEKDFYVALRHRNHLGIMTDGVEFLSSGAVPLIDFTDPNLNVRGGTLGHRTINNKRMMWAGDLNRDNKVVYQGPNNDIFFLFSTVLSASANTGFLANFIVSGYHPHDLNLDGKVIYQGPNNDRAMLLYNTVLLHPENLGLLANFIVSHKLP